MTYGDDIRAFAAFHRYHGYVARGNLCPGCDGFGAVAGECIFRGNDHEPPDCADEPCPVCYGEGVIATPLTEEDIARWSRPHH